MRLTFLLKMQHIILVFKILINFLANLDKFSVQNLMPLNNNPQAMDMFNLKIKTALKNVQKHKKKINLYYVDKLLNVFHLKKEIIELNQKLIFT